jgi:hypothetical protein
MKEDDVSGVEARRERLRNAIENFVANLKG